MSTYSERCLKTVAFFVWSLYFTSPVFAEGETDESKEEQLEETVVQGKKLSENSGSVIYDKRTIEGTPGGNGDITSILIRNPSVAFDNASLSSDTPGNLSPAKISINGAKHYDNLFLVDGLNAGSSISGGVTTEANSINESYMPKADSSLAISLDTKLLCNISVHDSGVGAEHGRFLGGVVEAEICGPRKKFGGDVSVEYTSSKWLEDKKTPGINANSTSAEKQNSFTKWTARYNFESQVSSSLGLVGSYTTKNSKIPLKGYSKGNITGADDSNKNAREKVENFMLKGFFVLSDDVDGDFTIMQTPSDSQRFSENVKDSYFSNKSGGSLYGLTFNQSLQKVNLSHKLSYKTTNSSRDGDANVKKSWRYSDGDKDWGVAGTNYNTGVSIEGGPGDINQNEKIISYKFKSAFKNFDALGAVHRMSAGLEVERNEYVYERPNDYLWYSTSTAAQSCMQWNGIVDTETCSLTPIKWNTAQPWAGSNGQYLNFRSKYRAGRINYNSNYFAIYTEDAVSWDAFSVRAGLRWESFSDAVRPGLSPRFNAVYDFGKKMGSRLSFGANRYYGQNLKAYQIWARALTLSSGSETRGVDANGVLQDWSQRVDKPMDGLNALKIPYADEFLLAWDQRFGNLDWRIKYVHRASKDEVTRRKNLNLWENSGTSQADVLTLSFDTVEPVRGLGGVTQFSAAFDYSKKKSTHTDWSEYLFDNNGDVEQIYYNGNVIDKFEMPPQNFHRPWTLRFMSSTEFKNSGIRLDTIFRIRQGFKKTSSYGSKLNINGQSVQPYKDIEMPKTLNFDIRVFKDWHLSRNSKLYAELSLENVFNRSNAYEFDGYNYQLEKGRQATLRIGYEF